MKVLVVRAAEDARRTADRLSAAGHDAVVSPALVIRTIAPALSNDRFDAALATSAHAFAVSHAPKIVTSLPLYVVGVRTAEAAQAAGWPAPKRIAPDAPTLAEEIRHALPAGARILYLAGRDRKPDLERALASTCDLRILEVYEAQEAGALSDVARAAIADASIDAALHYSRRSAEIFLRLIARAALDANIAHIRHVAISADAAAPLRAAGLAVAIARTPDEDAMFVALGGPAASPA